jgi:HEAT repeat protein
VREALVSIGDAAVAPVRALLALAPAPAAAASAAWVLGELRSTVSAEDIVHAMRQGTLPAAAALHALATTGSGNAVAIALEFVDDPSPQVRGEAFRAVGTLLDPTHPDGRAVEPLAATLRDVRLTAAERVRVASLLGRTGAPRARDVLVSLLSLRDPTLRLAAIDALGALGPSGADAPLLNALEDPDPAVRLHAAVSLADAGGAEARDALISRLGSDAELDRSATLTALAGILVRAPSDGAVRSLSHEIVLAAGPERDALILAIGCANTPAAAPTLRDLLHSPNVEDRRVLATVLPARRTRLDSMPMLRALLDDPDPSVRAEAAWSIGEIGTRNELPALASLVRGADADPAIDATGAIARIAARTHVPEIATGTLCPFLGDPRAYVRANAIAGLALASARCGDGSVERRILADDVEPARGAAARAIAGHPLGAVDSRALEGCTMSDRSGAVANRCREGAPPRMGSTHPLELYIATGSTSEPRPGSSFVAEFADGILRASRTDRRGAAFDAAAPEGDVSLIPIGASSR